MRAFLSSMMHGSSSRSLNCPKVDSFAHRGLPLDREVAACLELDFAVNVVIFSLEQAEFLFHVLNHASFLTALAISKALIFLTQNIS